MNDQDEERFNETLKRMLKTPPSPHDDRKVRASETSHKEKQDGNPSKNNRPAPNGA